MHGKYHRRQLAKAMRAMFTRRRGSIRRLHTAEQAYIGRRIDQFMTSYMREVAAQQSALPSTMSELLGGVVPMEPIEVESTRLLPGETLTMEVARVNDDEEEAPEPEEQEPCGHCPHCRGHESSWGGARLDSAPTLLTAKLRHHELVDVTHPLYGPHRYQIVAWGIKRGSTNGISTYDAHPLWMGLS